MTHQVLITGGRRGLGRRLALHLAGRGHTVHLLGRAAHESLDADLRQAVAGCFVADLADRAALDGALDAATAEADTRGRPFDVLIASAAVRPSGRTLLESGADDIRATLDVNLAAHAVIARALAPPMVRLGYGRLIFIGSRAGFRGSPREAAYGASKAGIVALAEALSREIGGRQVTVNAICPEGYSTAGGERVIARVLALVDRLIASGANGRIIAVASWRHRFADARRQAARAAGFLLPRG